MEQTKAADYVVKYDAQDLSGCKSHYFYVKGSEKFKIDSQGPSGIFFLHMESDNPAAYQAAYSTFTEEDGSESQQPIEEYVGTTENLLDIIRDLRARVSALEAGEVAPTPTPSGDPIDLF